MGPDTDPAEFTTWTAQELPTKIARIICASELGGFCKNVGHEVQGCMVGYGVAGGEHCKATLAQLALSGSYGTACQIMNNVPPPWRLIATDPPTQQMEDEDWVMLIGDRPASIPLPGAWSNEDQRWYSFNLAIEGQTGRTDRRFEPTHWRPIDRPLMAPLEGVHDDTPDRVQEAK